MSNIKPFTINVVHTKRTPTTDYTVNVGRPSVLGNRYTHLKTKTLAEYQVATVEEAVANYKIWLHKAISESITVCDALNHILNVGSKHGQVNLACWCKDELNPKPYDHICHAEVIREIINEHIQG